MIDDGSHHQTIAQLPSRFILRPDSSSNSQSGASHPRRCVDISRAHIIVSPMSKGHGPPGLVARNLVPTRRKFGRLMNVAPRESILVMKRN